MFELYENGIPMDRAVELAIAADWSRKGAEMGYAPSMARYAGYLVKGQGTPINYESAREYAEKVAALAEPRAYIVMAGLYGSGMGVEKNPDLAKKMLENAAKRGSAEAMYLLGDMYLSGNEDLQIDKNISASVYWLEQGAKAGDPDAMMHLAELYLSGGEVPKSIGKWLEWTEKAAQKGNVTALYGGCRLLGRQRLHQKNVQGI